MTGEKQLALHKNKKKGRALEKHIGLVIKHFLS